MSALVAATAPRPQTRAQLIAALIVHYETEASRLRDRAALENSSRLAERMVDTAEGFELRARSLRRTLRAVVRSEGCT